MTTQEKPMTTQGGEKEEEDKSQVLDIGQTAGIVPPVAIVATAVTLVASIAAAVVAGSSACSAEQVGAVLLALASGLLLLAAGVVSARSIYVIENVRERRRRVLDAAMGFMAAGFVFVAVTAAVTGVHAVCDCEMTRLANMVVLTAIGAAWTVSIGMVAVMAPAASLVIAHVAMCKTD
jgi:hypothetical protein